VQRLVLLVESVRTTSWTLFCFLLLFFTVQVWNLLVIETNADGRVVLETAWKDTCEEEMKAFLGILMVMGIKKFPDPLMLLIVGWFGLFHDTEGDAQAAI